MINVEDDKLDKSRQVTLCLKWTLNYSFRKSKTFSFSQLEPRKIDKPKLNHFRPTQNVHTNKTFIYV